MPLNSRRDVHPLEAPELICDVVVKLLEIELCFGGEPFQPTVDYVGDGVYRIDFESGVTLIVDAKRNVIDDPWMALTEGFPSVLDRIGRFRVTWRDDAGFATHRVVTTGSRRFARLHAKAPENAYVEQLFIEQL